jgi:hypothetical protein
VAAALIQNAAGKLEAMALAPDHSMTRYVRDDGGTGQWQLADELRPPPCDPAAKGLAAPPTELHIVGIHAAVPHTAKVVYFAFDAKDSMMGVSRVFDPAHAALVEPSGGGNQFCSGHVFLPDGRLFVAGGHAPEAERQSIHIFDPQQQAWSREPDMPRGRWYPTCVALPDGRAMVISGDPGAGSPSDRSGRQQHAGLLRPHEGEPGAAARPRDAATEPVG